MIIDYEGSVGVVEWRGIRLSPADFDITRLEAIRERALDLAARSELIAELNAMATTEMAVETITSMIETDPVPLDWQVGEALAEVMLEAEYNAIWPWNSSRDRKTPRASLPGADLVGFVRDTAGSALLFGEVKTSSDVATPPGVMNGRSGLHHQLENLAHKRELHFALLQWLRVRAKTSELRPHFLQAAQRFVSSNGRDFHLVGCLMRDTQPSERDLSARALAAVTSIPSPTRTTYISWYLTQPVSTWPDVLVGELT